MVICSEESWLNLIVLIIPVLSNGDIDKNYKRGKYIGKTKYTDKKDSDKINADFSRRKVI